MPSDLRLKIYEEIIYGPEDAVPLASNNHEAIVIEVITCNFKVKKVYIDNGSAIDVLYYKTFKELQLEDRQLMPVRTPVDRFCRSSCEAGRNDHSHGYGGGVPKVPNDPDKFRGGQGTIVLQHDFGTAHTECPPSCLLHLAPQYEVSYSCWGG